MAQAIEFTGLPASLQNALRTEKIGIIVSMLKALQTLNYVRVIQTDRNTPLPKLKKSGSVLTPGSSMDTIPTTTDNVFGFTERYVLPKKGEMNIKIDPLEWYSHFVSERDGRKWADPASNFTFEDFIIDLFKAAFNDDAEDLMWNGTGNPGDPIVHRRICRGFLQVLLDEIASGAVVPTPVSVSPVGPFSDTNALVYIRELYRAMPELYRAMPLFIYCSQNVVDAYQLDYQRVVGPVVYNTQYNQPKLDMGDVTFRPLPALAGSKRIIITTKDNLVFATGSTTDVGNFLVEKILRHIFILGDFAFDTNFADLEALVCNDEA